MKIAEQQKKTKETRETAAEQGWHQFITPRHVTPTPKEKSFLDKLAWGIGIYVTGGAILGYGVPKPILGAQKLLSKRGDIKKGIARPITSCLILIMIWMSLLIIRLKT